MNRTLTPLFAVALLASASLAGPKVKDSVNYATSWDAAVAEAKLLNIPLVVHSHGFN
jgi:hypothetical protein